MVACGTATNVDSETEEPQTKWPFFEDMLKAHGELGSYSFTFRGDYYAFEHHSNGGYTYKKQIENDTLTRLDVLTNDGFSRTENGVEIKLTELEQNKYSESVNSVIYFACLPLKLNDSAVNMEHKGEVNIKGSFYDVLEVSFTQDGGGTDFEDVFYYWINQESHLVDYLAYQYNVNGGGVRFREAFNSRMIGEMRFQDYINYGAPIGTALSQLPVLFEQGELDTLSFIVSEDVRPL